MQFFEREVVMKRSDFDSCIFVMILNVESEQVVFDFYYKFVQKVGVIEYLLNSIIGGDLKLTLFEKIFYFKMLVGVKV